VVRIEQCYSRYRDDSIIGRINAAAGGDPVRIDPETEALLNYAATAYAESDGLFDISSGVLREVWNFKLGQLPSPAAVAFCLKRVGWDKVNWQAPHISLQPNMQLDFGGFGKEYAADRAAHVCAEMGIAHGLVELGGDIRLIGPHPDGSPWQIGIRNPRDPEQAMAVIPLKSGGLASSGDYERYMVIDGKRYSHILNPRTGRPVDVPMAGVTVVAPLCLLAGTAATVAMLHGEKAAPAWLWKLGLPHLWINQLGEVGGDLYT
jgi:thiamine biosynthesis lipoprotein